MDENKMFATTSSEVVCVSSSDIKHREVEGYRLERIKELQIYLYKALDLLYIS
uniref:Uncharacterized protein n=1 Tax=Arundo donax TaxID=35708 RepID=A0A0A8ZL69_ARUDO